MKFLDFFSGIGGFHSGLELAGMECVGWCEFDKFAQASYKAMYDTDNLWFGSDVTKVKGKDLPKADLWTFGFPCQDISIAGKQEGIKEGTRSGLFYEIMRLLDECEENKPKWLVCENVKNLLSVDGGGGFLNVVGEMAERGYSIEWKVYNSKNYGVPQNRERIYVVGYYGTPSGQSLLPIRRESQANIKQVGNIINTTSFDGNPQRGRVYSADGAAPTLTCSCGGGAQPKVIEKPKNKIQNFGNVSAYTNDNTVWETGIARTLTASDYKYPQKVAINNGTKQGYTYASIGDGIDLTYPNSKTRRGRVQHQRSNTITTGGNLGVLDDIKIEKDKSSKDKSKKTIRIRKLTPLECWRLQGFTDEQFKAAAAVNSKTQLYKQAGNAVTVNVVKEIGTHIMNTNSLLH